MHVSLFKREINIFCVINALLPLQSYKSVKYDTDVIFFSSFFFTITFYILFHSRILLLNSCFFSSLVHFIIEHLSFFFLYSFHLSYLNVLGRPEFARCSPLNQKFTCLNREATEMKPYVHFRLLDFQQNGFNCVKFVIVCRFPTKRVMILHAYTEERYLA